MKSTNATVVANATAVMIVNGNPNRNYLNIQNTGTGDLSVGYDSTLVSRGGSCFACLDPSGTGSGGQGGSFEYKTHIPTGAIWAFSVAGTTISITEGGAQ